MMSRSGFASQRNSTCAPPLPLWFGLRPASKSVTVIGSERLSGSTATRVSPAMPRSSKACAVTVYVPSKTVEPPYCVVAQLEFVSGFWPFAGSPRLHAVVQFVGPPVESPAPLGEPSLFHRTVPAVVVVVGNVAVLPLASWLTLSGGAVKLVMRGPRPPDGLLISAVCWNDFDPAPVSQITVTVTRRKSSGC